MHVFDYFLVLVPKRLQGFINCFQIFHKFSPASPARSQKGQIESKLPFYYQFNHYWFHFHKTFFLWLEVIFENMIQNMIQAFQIILPCFPIFHKFSPASPARSQKGQIESKLPFYYQFNHYWFHFHKTFFLWLEVIFENMIQNMIQAFQIILPCFPKRDHKRQKGE